MKNINGGCKTVIKRKCGYCGEDFYISDENICDAIRYDKKTYHSGCFADMCKKRSNMNRKDVSQKWTLILNNLESIKKSSYEELMLAITKEKIFDFIKDAYDITIIPTTAWQKLSDVYEGRFKGMTRGIPPSRLLDMWKRKMNTLNDIADKNKTKGIKMSSDQRLSYDLSILINKYDSYLKWLEKQKIIETENLKKVELSRTDLIINVINIKPSKNGIKQPDNDMSDLVDDIFKD